MRHMALINLNAVGLSAPIFLSVMGQIQTRSGIINLWLTIILSTRF